MTAEPYFSVTRPSNEMVAENIIRQETKGFEEAIDAKFDMLEGGDTRSICLRSSSLRRRQIQRPL